ncbi:MAG: hypothetical protein ACN6O6_15405 [Pseudomonas sp.]|uniref:hypothetical protein n=1 Tax=Pseudomonas sp. TaxID=306 RepID=UPI003D132245
MLKRMFALLCSSLPLIAHAGQEAQFWNWFVANESALYRFTSPTDPVLDELSSQLGQVHQDLTFELGPVMAGGKREFIISAGGLKEAFPAVKALHAAMPTLDQWEVIKFRPRRNPMNIITLGEHTFDPARILCLLADDGEKIGVVLMHEDYEQDNIVFRQASYLLLDEALGEYVVETDVGFINVHGREARWMSQAFPMTELGAEFDHAQQQRAPVGL